MKRYILILLLFVTTIHFSYSQEEINDGVVSFNLPLRNSLTFNRFAIHPTFTFVREQDKYINFSNKREWVQFENAPLTYLAGYSGRFGENIGAGVSVFQQNYGVLTTFGGLLNFAYNVRLDAESNLTFGLNIGAYKSGLNTGEIVTNFDDPSINNVPENFLVTVNPGINYGIGFLDVGVSLKNSVTYNIESSAIIEDNPEQGIQGHLMYTGYLDSRGFFDESKFSGLVRSEFRTDETIISAMAMITVPKGIWAQAGYNTLYGASAGLGVNITPQIALEYNYEKALGDLTDFGPSHEFSVAYRFVSTENYEYSSGDEVAGLISGNNNRRKPKVTKKPIDRKALAAKKAKAAAEAEAQRLAEQQAKEAAEAEAQRLAEQQAQEAAEAEAQRLAEQQAKEAAEAEAQRLAEQQAKAAAEAEAQRLAEQRAKAAAEAEAQRLAEQRAKAAAEAEAKRIAEQRAKAAAEAEAQRLAEQRAKAAAEAEAKRLAEQRAKAAAEAEAQRLAEQQAKAAAEAEAQRLAEQQAKAAAEAEAKRLAEQEAKKDIIVNPTDKIGKEMLSITEETEDLKTAQNQLLKQFNDIVDIKDGDLQDLKEEYELSLQGIEVAPKPFKSVTEENNRLNAIVSDLENVIESRNKEIKSLKTIYENNADTDYVKLEDVNIHYRKEIQRLELEQKQAVTFKNQLEVRLKDINVATEIERKRRIKRAAFDTEEARYEQDREILLNIKRHTGPSTTTLTSQDFDFGEEQNSNIQILKNVKNVENGYYVIIAVHSDVLKRNQFVTRVIQAGGNNVDFFYDFNSSKYYIYYDKYDNIQAANQSIEANANKPFAAKMSVVKIEN
ncbi:PorP/SprF family type IX secretion system membrane protein [Bizionia paragorgiae]|uniref:PorP/SprF family type IX secretion system membrane protein n=1 Tax=Bizionia paragorgiae TaxID=283786 RepID=UPI00299E589B|nr:PorP/SprF family type IX secretion system membrane protein [Bizionia paragorgiae]MDX1271132.1 PorP/SprF family type IX secretion system membrane protein [Bizionia paragorgiae]